MHPRLPAALVGAVCLALFTGCGAPQTRAESEARPGPGATRTTDDFGDARNAPRGSAGSADVAGEGVRRDGPARQRPVAVLRAWDRSRADAYATGDLAALKRLYVPGSTAGAADVAVLRSYLRRGVRVEGMSMQLLAVDVLAVGPRRVRLRVTDRVAGATAVAARSWTRLPADAASTRVVELRRASRDTAWRVAMVRDVSG